MTVDTYKRAFEQAVKELADLMEARDYLDAQREDFDKRISTLRDGLLGLSTLAGIGNPQKEYPDLFPELIDPDIGITGAVRKVLAHSGDYLSPVAVRDGLEQMGFDIKKYKNILASIHQILKRLYDNKEAAITTREGKTLYKWNLPRYEIRVGEDVYGGGTGATSGEEQMKILMETGDKLRKSSTEQLIDATTGRNRKNTAIDDLMRAAGKKR